MAGINLVAGQQAQAWLYSTPAGANALAYFGGDVQIGSSLTVTGGVTYLGNVTTGGNFVLNTDAGMIVFGAAGDTFIGRDGAASVQLGAADSAAPVAQTFSVQDVIAGTNNGAGADWTIQGSQSTGSGVGGSIKFQTSPAGGAGNALNAFVTALTISTLSVTSALQFIGKGTATNDNAAAGNIGEYVVSNIPLGGAVALVNNTDKDVTTINLTAGDWDVSGIISLSTSVGVTVAAGTVSLVANTRGTISDTNGGFVQQYSAATQGGSYPLSVTRLSLNAPTTVHLVAFGAFASGTCSAFGYIRARRVR